MYLRTLPQRRQRNSRRRARLKSQQRSQPFSQKTVFTLFRMTCSKLPGTVTGRGRQKSVHSSSQSRLQRPSSLKSNLMT
nr:MAG TPA: hypothetical protein [Caudoviricetes sp.]